MDGCVCVCSHYYNTVIEKAASFLRLSILSRDDADIIILDVLGHHH